MIESDILINLSFIILMIGGVIFALYGLKDIDETGSKRTAKELGYEYLGYTSHFSGTEVTCRTPKGDVVSISVPSKNYP